MPDKTFQDEANFINSYTNYKNYLRYMQDWANSVVAIGSDLKSNPSCSLALSADEQQEIDVAVDAAKTLLTSVPIKTQPTQG